MKDGTTETTSSQFVRFGLASRPRFPTKLRAIVYNLNPLTRYVQSALPAGRMRLKSPQSLQLPVRITSTDRAMARFGDLTLTSVFQPIVDLRSNSLTGYEALLRASDDQARSVPALDVFRRASVAGGGWMNLDRSVQFMHALNFILISEQADQLFMNTGPQAFITSDNYRDLVAKTLRDLRLSPKRIVLEVLESPNDDLKRLEDTINVFREMGFLIALDDFGAGHSNVDRAWKLHPDIIKIDRTIIAQASASPRTSRLLPKLVSLLKEAGSLVLVEGVETEHEAFLALESGADFAQGFFFAYPAFKRVDQTCIRSSMEALRNSYHSRAEAQCRYQQSRFSVPAP